MYSSNFHQLFYTFYAIPNMYFGESWYLEKHTKNNHYQESLSNKTRQTYKIKKKSNLKFLKIIIKNFFRASTFFIFLLILFYYYLFYYVLSLFYMLIFLFIWFIHLFSIKLKFKILKQNKKIEFKRFVFLFQLKKKKKKMKFSTNMPRGHVSEM